MTDDESTVSSLTLNTQLEDDFIAPLTGVRGALEVLRDHPDLDAQERLRFLETALRDCARLERGVLQLAETVYPTGRARRREKTAGMGESAYRALSARVAFLKELNVLELDFSDFVFENANIVNDFFSVIDEAVDDSGVKWHVLVNFRDCRIWPEAWVAFAHRSKKLNVNHALSTTRYADPAAPADAAEALAEAVGEDDALPTREAALAEIARKRAAT